VPRCHGERGSQKYTLIPVEARSVICLFVGNSGPTTAHDVQVVIELRIIPSQVRFSLDPPMSVVFGAGRDARMPF